MDAVHIRARPVRKAHPDTVMSTRLPPACIVAQSNNEVEIMGQAFGVFYGSNGQVLSGSGNFSIVRQSAGSYLVTLNDPPSSGYPAVSVSPESVYSTAFAQLGDINSNVGVSSFQIHTGFRDQSGLLDMYAVHFQAFWN
jgi:hypothetical protein